jgi:hypothetical protein
LNAAGLSVVTALLAPRLVWAELPPDVAAAVQSIEDFSFSFSQPGFYALARAVKAGAMETAEPVRIDDWRTLLERSAEFRGRRVEIEGVVERNAAWRSVDPAHADLGPLWELQVARDDMPLICKLVLTQDAGDIPLKARVRCAGYFLMIQQYYSGSKRLRQAALLVAQGPTEVSHPAPQAGDVPALRGYGPLAAALAGLLVAYLLLRRRGGRAPRGAAPMPSPTPAPFSVADDLAAWASESESRESGPEERGK